MKDLILDVDTGNDDAVAIMLAAVHPDLRVLGCTTVAGNLPIDNTTDNTLRVLAHVGRGDVPVHRGLARPFAPAPFPQPEGFVSSAVPVHQRQLALPDAPAPERDQPAVEWLIDTLRAATRPVTLIACAPLTNIAAAVTVAPDIAAAVEELVVMGGATGTGNETSQAEFNIYLDPVAAQVVLNAGFRRLVMVPLDATRQALVSGDQCRQIHQIGTPAATATADILDYYIRGTASDAAAVHDALCVAYAIDPSVLGLHHLHVAVDTVGFHTYGRTLVDRTPTSLRPPQTYVALGTDADRFYELLVTNLAGEAGISRGTA